jgi:hypothetical protein
MSMSEWMGVVLRLGATFFFFQVDGNTEAS